MVKESEIRKGKGFVLGYIVRLRYGLRVLTFG